MTRAPGPDGNASPAGLAGVTVVIENLAPANGTWLTPVWVGLHDGTFDPFDAGAPASTALERLAEDGNTTPLEQLFDAGDAGHVQAVVPGSTGNPQLAPGESATHTFIVDPTDPTSQFLGLLSMVIPSNDAFIGADDPQAHRIFTAGGEFLGAFFTIEGTAVRDAGTEVNDEIPEHTAFFGQTVPNSGVDEGGVVHTHPGYLPPGSGGILDDPMFAAADFTQPGYDVARVTVYRSDTVVPTGTVSGAWSADGSPYLIEGDVTVPAGQTLVVEPGVIVYALGGHGILVEGTLEATGTAASPVLFTGDANGSGTDGWTGLRFENTTTTSRLEHCIVEHGDRYSTYESGGGLACIDASLELRSSTVRDNQAYLMGAGLYCSGGDLLVEDCRFSGNLIDGISSAAGGGIYCENADPVIRRTRFEDNRVLPFDQFGTSNARGGALALDHCGGLVERCVFTDNRLSHGASGNGESTGGAIYVSYGNPTLTRNTIAFNQLAGNHQQGGGIYFEHSTGELSSSAIYANDDVGVHIDAGSAPGLHHNDVFGNQDAPFGGPALPPDVGVIVQQNANGDPCDVRFNILLDPMFVDVGARDFHLTSTSPCIDAGDPDAALDPDGTVADIGAFYYDQGTTAAGGDASGGAVPTLLAGHRPEPFRASTMIRYELDEAVPVRLTIHDVTGRVVRELLEGERQARGTHRIAFDGRDQSGRRLGSGVYFYRLSAGDRDATGRLTIVR